MPARSLEFVVGRRFLSEWRSFVTVAAVLTAAFGLNLPGAHAQAANAGAEPAADQGQTGATLAAPARAGATGAPTQVGPANGAERRGGSGPHEGITVHGWWVIEVKNPDGKVTARREFENALTYGGQMLGAFLLGTETPGAWTILLGDSAGQYLLAFDEPNATAQAALDAGYCAEYPSVNACSANLAASVATSGALTLTGSVTVPNTFPATVTLGQASTELGFCPGNIDGAQLSGTLSGVSPGACLPTSTDLNITNHFTSQALNGAGSNPSPVPISPGQIVTATVTISFSSPS